MIYRIVRLCLCCLLVSFIVSCEEEAPEITNQAPTIAEQTFSVQEDSPEGTEVGTILASDPEQDILTFTIVSGNTEDAFAIHSDSGTLTVLTPSALSAEQTLSFALTVAVSDGQQSSSTTITVTVTETDEQLTAAPSVADQTFSLDENSAEGTVVGTVLATSNDSTALVFAIVSGNAEEVFAMDTATGEITVQSSSALDFEANNSFALVVEVGSKLAKSSATVTITLNDIAVEPLTTQEQIDQHLSASYLEWERYLEQAYLFDAVYTNTINSPSGDWEPVYEHTLTANNPKVLSLWSDARTLLFGLNNIIASASIVSSGPEQQTIIGQARLMRAYLHFTMLTWFGSIPLDSDVSGDDAVQVTTQEALASIENDLNFSITSLPAQWPNQSDRPTQGAARLLSARVSAFKQDWAAVLAQAEALIKSQVYSLSATPYRFTSDEPEVIWGFYASGDVSFSSLYAAGSFVPVFRLTEAYLLLAEAKNMMGNAPDALSALNILRERAGEEATSETNSNEISNMIAEQWQYEMSREGEIFAVLKRYDKATPLLSLPDHRLVLPIPQAEIEANANLMQNPGY